MAIAASDAKAGRDAPNTGLERWRNTRTATKTFDWLPGGSGSGSGGSGKASGSAGSGSGAKNGFDEYLSGGVEDDLIFGTDGNDKIDAGGGDDTVWADAGNDYVLGGAGNDSLSGEADNDIVSGGAGNDVLWGWTGNDDIFGGAGNDLLVGDGGNDKLHGGGGDDWIFGGEGNDSLFGGAGNDGLAGGDDGDTYFIADGWGHDTVYDSAGGNQNKIVIDGHEHDVSIENNPDGTVTLAFNNGTASITYDPAVIGQLTYDSGATEDFGELSWDAASGTIV